MLPVLMMTLHLLSQGVLAQWNRRPYFCAEAEDCYSFMTVCRDSEYETRAYEPSTWIGTRIFPREGRYRAVARLSEYFNKKNLPGIQIERTAPILTIFVNINGVPTETSVYSMLPRRLFNNPPIPRDVTVFIKQFPPMTVFVKSFGGWFTNIRQKAQDLFEDLLRQRESFLQNRFYTAQYNGPLTLFSRHNEVWYLSFGMPRCSARYGRSQSAA
ncbi:heme-binding protein 2-like [Heterodontus francisci]|uniref:heme-binding protein 2-like n=1 Tax=Heterodontus francisci TaxID=7792 RepID=UPI00355BE27E